MNDRGQWRIIARSTEMLSTILGVSASAITKAEERRRITREPDGTWEVLAAVRAWRATVNGFLQRNPPAVLDPTEDLNVVMLQRRARYAGARLEYQLEGEEAWHDLPDPVAALHRGEADFDAATVEGYFALGELNGLSSGVGLGFWLGLRDMAGAIVAVVTGVDLETGGRALGTAVDWGALSLIAATEEEWFGPATAREIRNGRIPLTHLAPDAADARAFREGVPVGSKTAASRFSWERLHGAPTATEEPAT